MKLSELKPAIRKEYLEHITNRWRQLYTLRKEWGEKALKYLFLANAGGAIATLSFLGASVQNLNLIGAKTALLSFLIGIFLAGIHIAKQFHFVNSLFTSYQKNVKALYKDEITWEELTDEDQKRSAPDLLDYAFPYASFISFIAGCIAGGLALF